MTGLLHTRREPCRRQAPRPRRSSRRTHTVLPLRLLRTPPVHYKSRRTPCAPDHRSRWRSLLHSCARGSRRTGRSTPPGSRPHPIGSRCMCRPPQRRSHKSRRCSQPRHWNRPIKPISRHKAGQEESQGFSMSWISLALKFISRRGLPCSGAPLNLYYPSQSTFVHFFLSVPTSFEKRSPPPSLDADIIP